ncbi:MAG: T9SS type A sorting domain-containing protein [Bacteroidia bacterium]|nr:T9SS type A sorting domain-containing protein [Bacteroidia bacterium]
MKTMKYILMMTLLTMGLQGMGQTIVYVKKTASGTNNGTSWTNAYTNLRTALTNAPSGAQVWIAADTFYVPAGLGRDVSFEITNKSLTLYGGFANTGSPNSISQRVPQIYRTILSGDINHNDTDFTTDLRKEHSSRAENAYNVVKISLSGANTYSVTIDGCWIQDGNANGTSDGNGKWGAGIYINRNANGSGSHTITIKNCVIRQNTAGSSAGIANYVYYVNNGSTTMNIHQNKFYHNIADEWAVMGFHIPGTNGVTGYGWNFYSNAVYRNVSLGSNTAILGAVCRNNSDPSSSFGFNINWNTFTNNACGNDGGVICAEGTQGAASPSNLSNFVGTNNIFWNNAPGKAIYRRAGARNFYGQTIVAKNLLQVTDSFNTIIANGGNLVANPQFVGPVINNYRLSPCSPAINAGSAIVPDGSGGTVNVNNSTYDVEENSRVQHSIVDRGAYEYFGTLSGPTASSINAAICPGSMYNFGGQNLNSPGTYRDTIPNVAGCDSVITLTLTMKTSSNDTFATTICQGDSFMFNSTNYGANGFYTATFTNAGGCDSVRTLNLTVTPLPQPTITRNGASLTANGGPFSSYQWYLNGNSISGATGSTHTPVSNGTYKVSVVQSSCTGTSADFSVGFVGVKEFTLLTGVNFYPNPSNGTLIIETQQPVTILIMNILGEVMKKEMITGKTTLQLHDLPKGIYLIGDEKMNAVSKLIIQ